jgi:hypothetical protein
MRVNISILVGLGMRVNFAILVCRSKCVSTAILISYNIGRFTPPLGNPFFINVFQ